MKETCVVEGRVSRAQPRLHPKTVGLSVTQHFCDMLPTPIRFDQERPLHHGNSCGRAMCLRFSHAPIRTGRVPRSLKFLDPTCTRCASGCVVECRICNREGAGSNLGLGYFAPTSTQPSIPPGSVNEYQLRLGRQRQVWLIPIADEHVGVQVKLKSLENTCHTGAFLRW